MSFLQQLEKKRDEPQREVELVYINSRPQWLSLILLTVAFGATIFSVIQLTRLLPLFDRNDFQTVWPVLLCVLSFPALAFAVYGVGRWLKFGESKLCYENGCNAVGSHLRGYVLANSAVVNATEINVKIVCIQAKRNEYNGKYSKIEELCRVTRKVLLSDLEVDGDKYRIPIQLLLPLSGKAAYSISQEPVRWTLTVHGEMPGIDYCAKFTLHVN